MCTESVALIKLWAQWSSNKKKLDIYLALDKVSDIVVPEKRQIVCYYAILVCIKNKKKRILFTLKQLVLLLCKGVAHVALCKNNRNAMSVK